MFSYLNLETKKSLVAPPITKSNNNINSAKTINSNKDIIANSDKNIPDNIPTKRYSIPNPKNREYLM